MSIKIIGTAKQIPVDSTFVLRQVHVRRQTVVLQFRGILIICMPLCSFVHVHWKKKYTKKIYWTCSVLFSVILHHLPGNFTATFYSLANEVWNGCVAQSIGWLVCVNNFVKQTISTIFYGIYSFVHMISLKCRCVWQFFHVAWFAVVKELCVLGQLWLCACVYVGGGS